MNLSRRYQVHVSSAYRSFVGILLFSVIAGCGLAMDSDDRLSRGEQAMAAGEYRAAVIDAKDVLLDEPDNVRARLLLGRASVKIGDGPSAEKEFRKAMQLGVAATDIAPEMARALLLQGKFQEILDDVPFEGLESIESTVEVQAVRASAYLSLDQPSVARESFLSVLESQPDNLDARLGVVSTFIAEENLVQARGGIEKLLETHSDFPRVWMFSGSFNARTGDAEAAEANFRVALDLAESQGDDHIRLQALTQIAETMLARGEAESARAHVDTLAVDAPESLPTKLLIARLAYFDKDWTLAQQNLQQVLRVAPDYVPAKVLLGSVHLQSGNLAQAEMYLSSAVATMPDNVWARQLLAETRLQLKKSDDAQQALAPIVSNPDADSVSLQMAARASLGLRKDDEAIKYLRRVADSNPADPDLRFQLAVTLLQLGRTDEAQSELDKIDVSDSKETAFRRDSIGVLADFRHGNAEEALVAARKITADHGEQSNAFSLLGAIELAAGNRDNAARSFEKALELDSKSLFARRSLAGIDETNGDLDSAAARYNAILTDRPDAAWAAFALGNIAVRREDYEQALVHFRRAFDTDAKNVAYRLAVARTENQLGNSSAAVDVLEDDMDMTLGHVPSGITLAMLHARSGDAERALEIASALQKENADNPAVFAFEGEVHLTGEDLERADNAYDKAVSLGQIDSHVVRSHQIKRRLGVDGAEQPLLDYLEVKPADSKVRLVLAEYYSQSDKLGKSIEAYERIVSDDPTNAVVLNNLAWSYHLAGDSRALETAQKALDAMQDNGAIMDTLGWIMVQQGLVEEGEKLLRQAADLENGRPEIRYHHAAALVELGKVDEAQKILNEILADNTEFASRKDAESLGADL